MPTYTLTNTKRSITVVTDKEHIIRHAPPEVEQFIGLGLSRLRRHMGKHRIARRGKR